MNEQIKELLEQVGIYQPERFDAIDGTNRLEEFAKLIIKECMSITENFSNRHTNKSAAETIQEYFGLK
jgi:hypothetical protein